MSLSSLLILVVPRSIFSMKATPIPVEIYKRKQVLIIDEGSPYIKQTPLSFVKAHVLCLVNEVSLPCNTLIHSSG